MHHSGTVPLLVCFFTLNKETSDFKLKTIFLSLYTAVARGPKSSSKLSLPNGTELFFQRGERSPAQIDHGSTFFLGASG